MATGGHMDEHWEESLRDEEWNRLEEICKGYGKDSGPGCFAFTGSGQKIWDWLRDKYRALYDLMVFLVDKSDGEDHSGEASIKDVDREVFARRMADAAGDYLTERFRDSWQAMVNGIVTEIDMNLDALMEMALGADFESRVKPNLITKKQWSEIWDRVRQETLNPKFVRDGRGGNRKSGAQLTETEWVAIVERKATLMPFWSSLISRFEKNDYENDVWDWIKNRPSFKEQCAKYNITSLDVLDDLVPQILSRKPYWEKEISGRMPEVLMPAAFALVHAAREMGVGGSYDALKNKVSQREQK